MNKEIHYTTYATMPSDYSCPDGQLAYALNVINDGADLAPLHQPAQILQCQPLERVIYVHRTPVGDTNYIIAVGDTDADFQLYSLVYTPGSVTDTSSKMLIGNFSAFSDITSVGNTLVLALSSGIFYILWKDGDYSLLGNKPPFISIDFGQLHELINVSDKFNIPGRFAASYSGGRGTWGKVPEKDDLAELTQSLYSLINQKVADEVTKKGYFHVPFFVRYAFRLYDGSYRWHSAPILMLNNICPPVVKYTDDGSNPGAEGRINATLNYELHRFALTYRILYDGAQQLQNWSDIVSGIDVFVSAPIYTYDQSMDIENPAKTSRSSLLLSLYDWYAFAEPSSDGGRLRTPPSSVFVGHYASTINGSYIDQFESTTENDHVIINIRQHPDFHKNIKDVTNFYKIAEINIDDIKWMQQMQSLSLLNSDLSALVTFPTLPDDYQSHHIISAKSLCAYNARLHLAGVTIAPPEPFPIRSCMQFSNPADYPQAQNFTVKVYSRINGMRTLAVHNAYSSVEADIFCSPQSNFPRYIYYPDASAYKMEFYISDSLQFIIPLTPHHFLNGAYYYSANFNPDPTPANVEPEAGSASSSVALYNKIYYSEVNNPFNFGLGIVTCGDGVVLKLSSAAKALSQGQFGQFPLYAFTTDGVWALEVSSTGTYSARQPITRDVCINPRSITQLDSAVLFASQRGIMLLQGSQASCISESIDADAPFNILSLPSISTLHASIGHSSDACMPVKPFLSFIADCQMAYDYTHQHIIIFNPVLDADGAHLFGYAYVYSLKSKCWGMMYSNLQSAVNSYPDALAMTADNRLVSFATTDDTVCHGIYITRPLKLDAPDVLKTISALIQRGQFSRGDVTTVLYASRDLYNWHLVWSSKDHYLRGFRGTPYKYFRIAASALLTDVKSVSGASVVYDMRQTNNLR